MLTLIESREEKIELHKKLIEQLKNVWGNHEKRILSWRPSSLELEICHNGSYWFSSHVLTTKDVVNARFWNPYGIYQASGNMRSTVEINVPTDGNSKRVAGMFARDPKTGIVYLMHDGKIGGGRKGFSQMAFLAWTDMHPLPVMNSDAEVRPAVAVAPLGSDYTSVGIERFIQTVADFKKAVERGETLTSEALAIQASYRDYFDEFDGIKHRGKLGAIDYVSRHGDIVRALRGWRQRTSRPSETIVKNAFIDLGVLSEGILTEVYEVKTTCDRQSLYTALGQLAVHGEFESGLCKRFIVLPLQEKIPGDLARAVDRAGIRVLRFDAQKEKIRIIG